MTRVKICGVTDDVAMDATVTAGADYVGFVFFPKSPRFVSPQVAASLSARHVGGPKRVALFVEPTDDQVAQVVEHVGPDILQLYASPERVVALREMFGLPVWRGVGITGVDDLPETTEGADALLLESKPPADATRPGGRAARFDWGVLTGWKPDFPWLLAGGLTPDNVAEAVHITGATVVDVSSGVESAPGVKDPALIRAFVHAARHR